MRQIIYKSAITLLATLFFTTSFGQNSIEKVLEEIEKNSSTLSALREHLEADKLANRTDIFLSNPELEFGYAWGSPSEIGSKTDFSVSQSFDFPTAYGHRNKLSKLANENLDVLYQSERMELLLRAKQVCIELAYQNALAKEYATRVENAQAIANSYQKRFDAGDVNILEKNKAMINLIGVENSKKEIDLERQSLLSELKAMNGGKAIQFTDSQIVLDILPTNFENWYAEAETKIPALQYIFKQKKIAEQEVKLNSALALPKFSAGYASEKVVGEWYKGVAVGISIPLWENKNKVKQAKAEVKANEKALEDKQIQFYNQLQKLYNKSFALQQSAISYRSALHDYNNERFLQKALDAGEISLLNYLQELEYVYDAIEKALIAERDFQLNLAELNAVML